MKTENNINVNPNNLNMQELNIKEMEDVTGGGIKEIVAATTLAAMAMTGNTVNAFGLANALAEENTAHVETAPEQETFGAEFEGAIEDEIVAMSVEDAVEESDLSLTEEGVEKAVFAAGETGLIVNEEAVEEVEESDLGELTGETDPEAVTDEPEDKTQLMAELIDMAVEEHKDEGIYATLNATFATLADNADMLANPETGVIETDGNEIVNMTYDALVANFDKTPEQLMGAIGAASLRADNAGYIQTLGGDQALVSLASNEADKIIGENVVPVGKTIFEGMLDSITVTHPGFRAFIPLLKYFGGIAFGSKESSDPNAEILSKLVELEKQLKNAEQNLMDNTYNVVRLAGIGDKFATVEDKADTIREYIGNIRRSTTKTEAQKLQEVADLYMMSEFSSLISAMNGATRCFTSPDNDIFDNMNIFDAAYDRACQEVMFSSEAIDICTPYLVRQLAIYTAAYATMRDVFDCYEMVYGADSLLESRETMSKRLSGVDLEGNSVSKSIPSYYQDFCSRDRFIFVNKSNRTAIKLNEKLVVKKDFAKNYTTKQSHWGEGFDAPYFMADNPLSADQVKSLAAYCSEKKVRLFDFLLIQMGFNATEYTTKDEAEFARKGQINISVPFPKHYDPDIGRYVPSCTDNLVNNVFLATGAQSKYGRARDGAGAYLKTEVRCNCINATKVGAGDENKVLRTIESYSSSVKDIPNNFYMMFFQKR